MPHCRSCGLYPLLRALHRSCFRDAIAHPTGNSASNHVSAGVHSVRCGGCARGQETVLSNVELQRCSATSPDCPRNAMLKSYRRQMMLCSLAATTTGCSSSGSGNGSSVPTKVQCWRSSAYSACTKLLLLTTTTCHCKDHVAELVSHPRLSSTVDCVDCSVRKKKNGDYGSRHNLRIQITVATAAHADFSALVFAAANVAQVHEQMQLHL
ncbi:hypothetical protein JKP88DRAFT_22347 [Tribonema minus]|uniref:Uncharacterized protein n=1 Tax=Tribonema minus TaxID=303371 RepID=A0A835Z9Y0_9STRA|nr:hypothetical protein JKP88DRAFT_22347 [Tribonema minus]